MATYLTVSSLYHLYFIAFVLNETLHKMAATLNLTLNRSNLHTKVLKLHSFACLMNPYIIIRNTENMFTIKFDIYYNHSYNSLSKNKFCCYIVTKFKKATFKFIVLSCVLQNICTRWTRFCCTIDKNKYYKLINLCVYDHKHFSFQIFRALLRYETAHPRNNKT